MRRLLAVAFVVMALAPALVVAQEKVTTEFDKTYDFSQIKTFAVQVATSWNDPLSEQRVVGEVTAALTSKGWTAVDASKANAMVLLHGATQEKKQLNTFYGGAGPWGWRGMGVGEVTESDYTVGTLVVDIFDATSKKLLFRGTASDELSPNSGTNDKHVEKATNKMFYNFPPAPPKTKK